MNINERIDADLAAEDKAAADRGEHWAVWQRDGKPCYYFARTYADGTRCRNVHVRSTMAKVRDVLSWMGNGLPVVTVDTEPAIRGAS